MRHLCGLANFLTLQRNSAFLLVALVLAGTGERPWLRFAPKYLETLGASVLIIGLFDALPTFLGAVYAFPGGWLTDRWGQWRSLLQFNMISFAARQHSNEEEAALPKASDKSRRKVAIAVFKPGRIIGA